MESSNEEFHGFLLASTSSGGGKTTLTLGILSALKKRGMKVQPFKCGQDFIDPEFHKEASDIESINLDTWMMGESGVQQLYEKSTKDAQVAVVEGVMGLFDGANPGELVGSSADIARILSLPVILVVDAKGMAGSIAAIVKGFSTFHPEVKICGVIANRVGSARHVEILSEALSKAELPKLLGAIPHNPEFKIPERHLGLQVPVEISAKQNWYTRLGEFIEESMDIDSLLEHSCCSKPMATEENSAKTTKIAAIAYDEAFHFYYRANFDYLRKRGYEICFFSVLHDTSIPQADFIYIGGGFPESYAAALEANESMKVSLRDYVSQGGEIYAECGGYVYLCETLRVGDTTFQMCDIIKADATLYKKRRALGYRTYNTISSSLFATSEAPFRGHEFHYTDVTLNQEYEPLFNTTDSRGKRWQSGIQFKGLKAGYQHLYFPSSELKELSNGS